ncbi:hypothetical protein [Arenimonas fontis]|uniref:Uncharacterized protein n=1 Tax=Arenimonas fontis TaxID=2608255 RepID=A0A5B2ZGL7_9GAMM|nr:hypothetical protein [Arenimonas fontis]KAA2286162.1 hypothetical protein F0415_01275 [Arenimonas fontis]
MLPPSRSEADPPSAAPVPSLPGRTTPTWEMELLLSGATVFALWQLAGWMAPFTAGLLPRLDPRLSTIGAMLYLYLATGVITLGMAFVLHLALRAYWVALVGMHSVFPGGLRLDRLRAGPVAREALRRRWQDMDQAMERADNRATLVFGLGIGVAAVLVPITLMVAALYGLVLGLCWALDRLDLVPRLFIAVTGLVLLPYFLCMALDRWLGERLTPEGWPRRALAACFGLYARLGMSRESNPLVTLYSSHVGERRSGVVVTAIILVSIFLASTSLDWQQADLGPGQYGRFPESGRGLPGTVDGAHYASLQEPGESPERPFLPAPVLRGRHAALVLPFVPARHARHLAACERASPGGADAAATRLALLDCYAGLHEVKLDGRPLPVRPEFYLDPSRDLRGLIYMIPLAELAPGRHELEITLPDPRRPGSASPLPRPERIPFWR